MAAIENPVSPHSHPFSRADMPRPQSRDREFDKPALQARALRTRNVRRLVEHAEQGREARIANRPRRRVAKPRLCAPGRGRPARGVERAHGRLG